MMGDSFTVAVRMPFGVVYTSFQGVFKPEVFFLHSGRSGPTIVLGSGLLRKAKYS
jgi:hypothetical protein